jgi:hypothetical protein
VNFKVDKIGNNNVGISFTPPMLPKNTDGSMPDAPPKVKNHNIIVVGMDADNMPVPNGKRIFLYDPMAICVPNTLPNSQLAPDQQFVCSYSVPITAEPGEVYYKIGLMSIYSDGGNSNIVDPSNIGVFKLGVSLDNQLNIYKAGTAVLQAQFDEAQVPGSIGDAGSDMYLQNIRASLGGYPDNLLLDAQDSGETGRLAELAAHDLALGVIDVKINPFTLGFS